MRLLVFVMFMVLLIGSLGFLMTNLSTTVPVTLWSTEYRDVHIFYVVIASFFVGALFMAIIAVVEGARTRLDNRRLRRELHRLETELNYQRTQPSVPRRPEPDAIEPAPREPAAAAPAEGARSLPSAPVYEGGDEWSPDADDDAYSGGRAV